ncbi:hypothetical protein [Streptomyces goshikiensis]|uniref:hypothetical protein n=1 Tax=Streptomyces goshikiensis TaxID=1942 RepID=UPI0036518689
MPTATPRRRFLLRRLTVAAAAFSALATPWHGDAASITEGGIGGAGREAGATDLVAAHCPAGARNGGAGGAGSAFDAPSVNGKNGADGKDGCIILTSS